MTTLASRHRAQTAFLVDLHRKYGKNYLEMQMMPGHDRTLTAKELASREAKAQRMDNHYRKMFDQQVSVVNKHNERGIYLNWPRTATQTPPATTYRKNEPPVVSSR